MGLLMAALIDQPLKTSGSSVTLSNKKIEEFLIELNYWQLSVISNIKQINRTYQFKNFTLAMAFANQITDLAEQANHHPRICVEWGKVNISWWTHSIAGLSVNDFIMAARCDKAYQYAG